MGLQCALVAMSPVQFVRASMIFCFWCGFVCVYVGVGGVLRYRESSGVVGGLLWVVCV